MQLKKALLASAIAALSTSAFAMQSMDDAALSETTGQDGLTISVIPPAGGLSAHVAWHDIGGFTGATGSGAVFIGEPDTIGTSTNAPFKLVTGTSGMAINIDAAGDVSGTAGVQPGLRVQVFFNEAATISTGDVSVADTTSAYVSTVQTGVILDNMAITLGAGTTATLYLGNELDGKGLINIASTITNGISIAGFGLKDVDNTGEIGVATTTIRSAGSANLALDVNIDALATGLSINMGTSTTTASFDITLVDVTLGSAVSMGDVQIKGLNLVGTSILVAGHP